MTQMTRPEYKIAWPLNPPENETSCNDGNRMSASPAKAFAAPKIAASSIAPPKNLLFRPIRDAQSAHVHCDFPALFIEKCALSGQSRFPNEMNRACRCAP